MPKTFENLPIRISLRVIFRLEFLHDCVHRQFVGKNKEFERGSSHADSIWGTEPESHYF